jgi:hypothetical protein
MEADRVAGLIGVAAANAPRSLQQAMGPSEAGEPCTRRLAYKMLHMPHAAAERDVPWAAIQGTAVHAWMADVFRGENKRLGRERYLVEHRVRPASDEDLRTLTLPSDLSGSCDLFDRDTGTVTDWKLTSPTRLKEYVRHGPGDLYRIQGHLYGRGMASAGEDVRHVSVVFLPRTASLASMHTWSEPYDPAVAESALRRLAGIRDALFALDPEKFPGMWELFPASPQTCRFCPWLKPGSRYLAAGCPGHPDAAIVTGGVESLIAEAS